MYNHAAHDWLTCRIHQIEIAKNYGTMEWHEDLKLCLMQAGVDDKSVVFLFNDTQVRCAVVFMTFRQSVLFILDDTRISLPGVKHFSLRRVLPDVSLVFLYSEIDFLNSSSICCFLAHVSPWGPPCHKAPATVIRVIQWVLRFILRQGELANIEVLQKHARITVHKTGENTHTLS